MFKEEDGFKPTGVFFVKWRKMLMTCCFTKQWREFFDSYHSVCLALCGWCCAPSRILYQGGVDPLRTKGIKNFARFFHFAFFGWFRKSVIKQILELPHIRSFCDWAKTIDIDVYPSFFLLTSIALNKRKIMYSCSFRFFFGVSCLLLYTSHILENCSFFVFLYTMCYSLIKRKKKTKTSQLGPISFSFFK